MDTGKTKVGALFSRTSTRVVLVLAALGLAVIWFSKPTPPTPRGSGKLMRAVVYHEYGAADVLRLEAIDTPLPGEHQVLVKVRAASVNPLDWHYMRGTPYIVRLVETGISRPRVPRLGVDVAGEVVAVGPGVTRFKPGDAVFGAGRGSFAEYVLASDGKLAPKPANLTFEQAAAVPVAALTALQALRDKGHLRAGQKVLINGASGGVGTFAVQIAKSYGAEVTGVCSVRNVAMVRAIGADHVIDYTTQDFTQGDQRYDVILDTVGNRDLLDLRRVLSRDGIAVMIGGGGPDEGRWVGPLIGPIKALLLSLFVRQDFEPLLASINADDLGFMKGLLERHEVTPVIDSTFELNEVPVAIRHVEQGHARGKVVISVTRAD